MKIYIDIILFVNSMFDFLLLFGVNIILKRNIKFTKLLLGSFIGAISVLLLFIKLNNITLFLLKIFISIIMTIITFKYQNFSYFIKNLIYLYILSIFLGGFLYFINNSFSYNHIGLIFINNGYSLNIIIILLISPLIIIYYIKEHQYLKINNSCYKTIKFIINKKAYNYKAYIDTGNKLKYYGKSVILVYIKELNFKTNIYIPYETIKDGGVIKGLKTDVYIDNKLYKNKIIGFVSKPFSISNVNAILPIEYL